MRLKSPGLLYIVGNEGLSMNLMIGVLIPLVTEGQRVSVSSIPEPIRYILWGRAGGICQFPGCNQVLYRDQTTKSVFNQAYIAHIVADKPGGKRGDKVLSPLLAKEISNLMLLCDTHHRLIDGPDHLNYPVAVLNGIKERHEKRMEMLHSLLDDKQSHVLLYTARVGEHDPHIDMQVASLAMLPHNYPADHHPIILGTRSAIQTDKDANFWKQEVEGIRSQFQIRLQPRLSNKEISHLSIFAFAPMPLLMELGRLLSDIPAAQVYECHRNPPGWQWNEVAPRIRFSIIEPPSSELKRKKVALVLSLSANITKDRIHAVLGNDVAIWEITHKKPIPGFLKTRQHLADFSTSIRTAFNQIKLHHSREAELHVFPAVPLSAAIEVGRSWMPKADLPFKVYDQNHANGGFTYVHDIA
jgi:hypothetical protein